MARFLFSIWPEQGHMAPTLPVAYALRAAGHEVAYITLPNFQPLLTSHNISYFPWHDGDARAADESTDPTPIRPGSTAEAMRDAYQLKFVGSVPAHVSALQQVITAWQPDVLVNDPVSYAPLLVAELIDRPIATLNVTTFAWPGADFGPFGLGLPPARDEATRARYAVMRAGADRLFAPVADALNAVRASCHLPSRAGPLPLATISPYLQLLPTIPEFDYERDDLPPQAHYVGPCLWDTPEQIDAETAVWLDTLPSGLPLVLVTASTQIRRTAGLVETAIGGLSAMEVAVLAVLPFDHPLHQAPLPAQVRLTRFVPYDAVLPRCAALVTHGGFGTVAKAIARYELPPVLVPFGSDQLEVAGRAVAAGAGVRLNPAGVTPAGLRAAVEAVLAEEPYRTGARRLAAAMARYDGPTDAAVLLERLAATGQPILREARYAEVI